ncbi:39S ribosomal protein L3, mitochondrial [Diachasma alloeum]|uniref:39S ribosomal protein L3, mitochondrial n=1 Tax=Diachasma alloeum TaxID=454923 RepID=UPI0007382441|nr:39S ribosomal protein L3, mitochondrial [Diachasma alloeum]
MAKLFRACSGFNVFTNFLKPRLEVVVVPNRGRKRLNPPPKKRHPLWFLQQDRALNKDDITKENAAFVQEVIESKYGTPDPQSGSYSPLKVPPIEPTAEWTPESRRTGVIARKIGIYPMWLKNGKKVLTTLLHVCDNHVIKYIPPEDWTPMIQPSRRPVLPKRKQGCLLVGADSVDPQKFTKQYCGLFTEAGVMPKRLLCRFMVTPNAALQPGTPLMASHYRAGDFVDIRAKTMDRGFQGVMKRWGFKGMPATHGVTKTHRRPGNIGSGGNKSRIMPGTKLPGHMGNRYRKFVGIKILRVDYKHNVLWVLGQALPGETNSLLQIYDSILNHRKIRETERAPPFPTYIPGKAPLPDVQWDESLHQFDAPTIEFEVPDNK